MIENGKGRRFRITAVGYGLRVKRKAPGLGLGWVDADSSAHRNDDDKKLVTTRFLDGNSWNRCEVGKGRRLGFGNE